MSTTTMAEQDWFTAYQNTVIGQTFVGHRMRLHVADLIVVAPHSLCVRVLCGAGDYGGVDVNTVVRNINLDGSSEEACSSWWQQKVILGTGQDMDQILPAGRRRPRICPRCQAVKDAAMIQL